MDMRRPQGSRFVGKILSAKQPSADNQLMQNDVTKFGDEAAGLKEGKKKITIPPPDHKGYSTVMVGGVEFGVQLGGVHRVQGRGRSGHRERVRYDDKEMEETAKELVEDMQSTIEDHFMNICLKKDTSNKDMKRPAISQGSRFGEIFPVTEQPSADNQLMQNDVQVHRDLVGSRKMMESEEPCKEAAAGEKKENSEEVSKIIDIEPQQGFSSKENLQVAKDATKKLDPVKEQCGGMNYSTIMVGGRELFSYSVGLRQNEYHSEPDKGTADSDEVNEYDDPALYQALNETV